jgi:glycosyltransferase involved in cell wall biosynthesis
MDGAGMSGNRVRVSIGLPVFNGEKYLAGTLDSLLAQTFTDWELIISDNASTDGTGEICRTLAAQDPRVRYIRNQENIGAAANYNQTFALATGKYFKWSAHDDLCAPTFLERCVEVLDQDASVILCYSRTKAIDESGAVVREYPAKVRAGSLVPHERFYEFVCVPHPCVAVFGLIRAEILAKTRLIGNYSGADRPLLSELCLLGPFHEISDFLFFYRRHAQQSWQAHATRRSQQAWYDPARAKQKSFPQWRLLREHLRSIQRAPLGWQERAWCTLYMGRWVRTYWRHLAANLVLRDYQRRK